MDMNVKVKLIKAKDFIKVTSDGRLDHKASEELLLRLAQAKRPPADFDLLVDLRKAQVDLTTIEIYELAAALAKIQDSYRDRIALLVNKGKDFDDAEFFENCSRNKGLVVETFDNFEAALDWIYEA